jgi:hypothetical protein
VKRALLFALLSLAACGPMPPGSPQPPLEDGGPPGDGGGKPFGAPCLEDHECESNTCFRGNRRSFCSMPCTPQTQAADCPAPPTTGTCNMQGFCKA